DRLSAQAKLALLKNPHGGIRALLADCADCAVDALVAAHRGPAWDREGFTTLRERVRAALDRTTLGVVTEVLPIVTLADQLAGRLERTTSSLAPAVADLRAQLGGLIGPGFITEVGWQRLPDLRRWLQAAERRLDKLPSDPDRDARAMAVVQRVQREYERRRGSLPAHSRSVAELERIRWMIEELRVSLFAQQLGTAYPVSEQRVYRALDAVAG